MNENNLAQQQSNQVKKIDVLAILSIVFGIISVFTTWLFFGIFIAIPALIISIIALIKRKNPLVLSIIGLVCSILAILIFVAIVIIVNDPNRNPVSSSKTEETVEVEIPQNTESDTTAEIKESTEEDIVAEQTPTENTVQKDSKKENKDNSEKKAKEEEKANTTKKETEPVKEETKPEVKEETPKETKKEVVAPEPEPTEEEIFIKELSECSEYISEETAKNIYQLLSTDLGFTEVEFYQKNKVGDLNFDIRGNDYQLMITADDDAIYNIICGDYVLYRDGEVLLTKQEMDDRHIEKDDRHEYYFIAKEIVTANLLSPKTAEFPSITFNSGDISMGKNGDLVVVSAYVDAQNGFGALIRSQWLVEFRVLDIENLSYEVVYINIDGTTAGEYIDIE